MSDEMIEQPVEAEVIVTDPVVESDAEASAPADDSAAPVEDAPAESAPKTRAAPTNLEADVRSVTNDYVTGAFVPPNGKQMTPHVIAAEVARRRGDGKSVSSGAVVACLQRWVEVGFAKVETGPTRFVDYTDDAVEIGLAGLKERTHAAKMAAKAAAKAEAKAATAPEPEAQPATEPEQIVVPAEAQESVSEQPLEDAASDPNAWS